MCQLNLGNLDFLGNLDLGALTNLLGQINSGNIIDIITEEIPDSINNGDDYERPTNNLEIKPDKISQTPLFDDLGCNR